MQEDQQRESDVVHHLREIEILRDPTHPSHCAPGPRRDRVAVLDVGCGAGGAVGMLEFAPAALRVGVDVDRTALSLARGLFPHAHFIQASGQALPFRDASFDFVISRVATPYMRFPESIHEMHRTLTEGGAVWLSLHDWRMLRKRLVAALRTMNVKNISYNLYVLMNGLRLHFRGRTGPFPLNPRRHESFQTSRGITAVLRRVGFEHVQATRTRHFIVEGARPKHAR